MLIKTKASISKRRIPVPPSVKIRKVLFDFLKEYLKERTNRIKLIVAIDAAVIIEKLKWNDIVFK